MRTELRLTAAAFLGFVVLALAIFRPTPAELAHTIPSFRGNSGDALLLVWATSHVSKALFADPLHLFDAPIYFPAHRTLAYGDHMIGEALLGLPVWLTTRNPLLEYNLLSLAAFVLGATTAFRHRRATGGGVAGAVAAGLVFSFTPFRLLTPFWLQVLVTFAMPLALDAWLRFVRDGRGRDLAVWIGWWVLHSLMGMYLALYFAVVMGVLALTGLVLAPVANRRRLALATFAAPLACGLLLAPTLWPYLVLHATQGQLRTIGLGTHWTFLLPGPGTWSGDLFGLGRPVNGAILSFGPGLFTAALALAGIAVARVRARDDWARFVWLVHVVGLATTLALVFVPVELQLRVPGFDMIRLTNRAFHVSLLFLGWFAGATVDALVGAVRAVPVRRAVAVAVVAALALDVGRAPHERRELPVAEDLPPVYDAVRRMPEPVLYERTDGIQGAALAMYFSIFHGKRLVNGYSGFTSPGPAFATARLFDFPASDARDLLAALDVRAVLLRDVDAARLERRLAPIGPEVERVFREPTTALLRVPPLAQPAPVAAVPLARDGWSLDASDGRDLLPALVDGDPRTVWSIETSRDARPWLAVDLGAVRRVAGVRCAPSEPAAPGIYLADVEASLDGRTWDVLPAHFDPDSLAMLYERPAAVRAWDARFVPRDARWLRLSNSRLAFWGGAWEIADLDVLAPAAER